MLMTTGQTAVTEAEDDTPRSAWLVAVTVHVAGAAGPEYSPESEIAPQEADHVTAVFAEPETEAENWIVWPISSIAAEGVTLTLTRCVSRPQAKTKAAQHTNTSPTLDLCDIGGLRDWPCR
jgi:hypothetical protein